VQSWRGRQSLASCAKDGYQGILSYGYYLDQLLPAAYHYAIDPLGDEAATLPHEAQQRILGGEACLWGELVSPENVDSRIWPRGCAVAERLWSPATVTDISDMYRRMAVVSERMEWLGLTHHSSYATMLKRIAGYRDIAALRTLADILEPMKLYSRHKMRTLTGFTPLTGIADAVRPESDVAREFAGLVDRMLEQPADAAAATRIEAWLRLWRVNHTLLLPMLRETHLMRDLESISLDVSLLAGLGLRALEALRRGDRLHWAEGDSDLLKRTALPRTEVFIAVDPSIRKLLEAAR
jgi:hexosaminidase